jgi:hypothetical protein
MNIITFVMLHHLITIDDCSLYLDQEGCKLGQSLWCQNHLFLRFWLLNNLNRTALKLRSSCFLFCLRSSSIFHFSSWVKRKLHTENQLPILPQSGLKVPGLWWVPNHYQVKLQLMLRLSWAVTIIVPSSLP